MNGKFYWLKLKRDFFKRHDIKILESMPDGQLSVLFYLKLMLEAVDHEGTLRFSDKVPYSPEMLATITNTDVEIARVSIERLQDFGLIEITQDGTIIVDKVKTMIGCASDSDAAKRQKRYRERKKQEHNEVLQRNVTPVTPVTTKNNESKSIEIDIEKEIDKEIDINIDNTNNTIVQSVSPVLASKEEKIKLLFAEFWKAYPRKENKKKAYSSFKNIRHIEQLLPDILSDLETRKLSDQWNKEGGKYIPLPTTYLNGERWNDESGITTKQSEIENAVSDVYDDFFN